MADLRIHSPDADQVWVVVDGVDLPLARSGGAWIGSVPDGVRYGIRASGDPARAFDRRRVLIDPHATAVWFSPDHDRDAARADRTPPAEPTALAVAVPWPDRQPPQRSARPLVVYEAHVRGLTMGRSRGDRGTFLAAIDELDRLAGLGVSVVELLPVHAFDPDEANYWGYMPVVFGAIHGRYASSETAAAGELVELAAAAHARDMEVWLDVVFNHTSEEDDAGPVYNLRGLAAADYYVVHPDGTYLNESGTGNTFDVTSAAAQGLVVEALERLADLGIDGFRFDLASVLARDADFVRRIGDWAVDRGVRLIAEPWDLARNLLGRGFPDDRWMQWNGRFRDDVRGFLRGEGGLVTAMMHRLAGSPDLFERPMTSVNFLTAHDGFTMYDLVAYERKHNDANGWDNRDGTDDHRSWNGGWEGDDGAPVEVMETRRRQLRNAMCLLLLSHGVPMFVAGDEFARTQHGNNNPYNQDNETSWIDWTRREEWVEHEGFVRRLLEFRAAHPMLSAATWWGNEVEWFGATGPPDTGGDSRSLAWHVGGMYVLANMWWEPLDFEVQVPGSWCRLLDTGVATGFIDTDGPPIDAGSTVHVGGRSIVVLVAAP